MSTTAAGITMAEKEICGGWGPAWGGRCEHSARYPDGRCGKHSDYVENPVGPTAATTKQVCELIRKGMSIEEAADRVEGTSRNSHDRWERAAADLAEREDFGNNFVEYRSLIERSLSEKERAPHRWLSEAAIQLDFAVDILADKNNPQSAVIQEYADSLRRKADEIRASEAEHV